MTSRPRRLALALVALVGLSACMRPPEPPPPRARSSASHRVRLLDEAGEPVGTFRVRRRSVAANDVRGVRMGRAVALPGRVEVRDRRADLILALRLEEEDVGETSGARARIENGTNELLGYLELWDEGARVRDASGTQIGEVRLVEHEGSGLATNAELYGAPGTDLLGRIVETAHRSVEVKGVDEAPMARLDGLDLDPRAVGLMVLPAPDAPAEPETESSLEQERLYEAGVLLFGRLYGD